MPETDIAKLRLDRTQIEIAPHRRRRRWAWIALLAVLVGAGGWFAASKGVIEVETVSVTTAYPYQAFTLLNATGYVVAQRKASVSSKATGRLEWLGVQEGSAVKENEVIARLESRDVRAQADQAQAQVTVALGENPSDAIRIAACPGVGFPDAQSRPRQYTDLRRTLTGQ